MRIELRNVKVELGGKAVLQDVNLTLAPGSITAVSGCSGCGTSVLLKTAAGLVQPTGGAVFYDDRNYALLGEKEQLRLQTRTGFMFQDAALWANMPLAGNLDLPLQAKYPAMGRTARRKQVADALAAIGFALDLSLRPVALSLGEQKFVSFLRALIPGPEAIFLDEPLAGLDDRWAEIVLSKLTELRAAGATVVLGSHQADLPAGLVDQQVFLGRQTVSKVAPCRQGEAEGTKGQ